MAGLMTSYVPRRDSLQPPFVAISNEPQEDRSAPPPPSEKPWSCDEDYKYPIKSSTNSLERCDEILEKHDENTYRQLKEEINFLMVVAGLFLAIVTAFTIESYKFLQEDKQDTMSDLLIEVVRLLNDTSAQGTAQLPKPFTPKHHDIVVNQLWFLSIILSLIAVAMGTFCLQWISALSRGLDLTAKNIPFHESLALRQLRQQGLDGWGVRYAPEALLFIVQLSIGLFICGLVYFLWNVSETAAIPTLVITGIAATSFCLVNLLPFLQPLVGVYLPAALSAPPCPYKSPTSWFIYNAGIVLLRAPEMFRYYLLSHDGFKLRLRSKNWTLRLTGFDWKAYDWTCQLGVCSRLSYFQTGLISALDRFPYEGGAQDIISSYIKNLVPSVGTAQIWEILSDQELSDDAKLLLDHETIIDTESFPGRLHTDEPRLELVRKIRVDFLSALILQHLTLSHKRLHSQLLDHRIELYIRVKNSPPAYYVSSDGGVRVLEFGGSLNCPLAHYKELNIVLKSQFLHCVKHLIDTRRFNDDDIISAATIIQNESAASMTLSRNIQNLSGTQHMVPPAEEEHTGLLPNQSPPRNDQIGNISNQPDSETVSSPPNDLETSEATHKSHQPFRASFKSLCLEVKKQLLGLRRPDFDDGTCYVKLRRILDSRVRKGPQSVHTGSIDAIVMRE